MTKPFTTKQEAQAAAASRPLSGAVWISAVAAAALKLPVGWYVGFPRNIDPSIYGSEA